MKYRKLIALCSLSIITLSGCDWFGEGVRQVGVANFKEQWAFAYECDENLKKEARQVCKAQRMVDETKDPDAKIQMQTIEGTFEMNYAKIQGDCEAGYRNAFQNKYIRPADVPDHAANLEDLLADPEICSSKK